MAFGTFFFTTVSRTWHTIKYIPGASGGSWGI